MNKFPFKHHNFAVFLDDNSTIFLLGRAETEFLGEQTAEEWGIQKESPATLPKQQILGYTQFSDKPTYLESWIVQDPQSQKPILEFTPFWVTILNLVNSFVGEHPC